MPFRPASQALQRFTVLDLTRVRSGPTAVRQLADWGANVVKIEMPEGMETGDAPGGPRQGSDFQNLQRNKRAMTLNLKSPEGVAVLKRMAERADVILENFRPDVKDRLGIGYEDMRKVNRRIVYGSISGFGQDGPYRERPGFDQIAQGMGGLMSITGLPGQGPVRVGIPIADLTAGIFLAYGVVVALLEREVSGEGQWVHTSLLQAQMFMLDFQAARWLMDGEVPKQAGNNHPTSIPTGVFKTRDGHINIAVTGRKIWERFCKAIGAEDLMAHKDYASAADRSKNRDALNAEIERRLQDKDGDHWIDLLNAAGVPCGRINRMDEVFADPQVRHLEPYDEIDAAKGPKTKFLAQPVRLSRTPSKGTVRPPEIGEHTDEILKEFGYSDADIAGLRARGVI
jgi:crotonobetainyl-CoA:carnitine CoA-transferase CaiB-like acyl-CoA transferase